MNPATTFLDDGPAAKRRILCAQPVQERHRTLRAKVEAEQAVQAELERRAALLAERSDLAQARSGEALERAAKNRAQKAFMEAGGTLGHFSRWWLERGTLRPGFKP